MKSLTILRPFALAVATLLAAATLLAPGSAQAEPLEDDSFGLGVSVGAPTALDFKWYASPIFGLNVGVGSHYFSRHIAVYLDGEFNVARFPMGRALGRIHIGPSLTFGSASHDHYYGFVHHHGGRDYFAVGGTFGFETDFWFPLNLFIDVRPAVAVVGHEGVFDISGHAGARFRF